MKSQQTPKSSSIKQSFYKNLQQKYLQHKIRQQTPTNTNTNNTNKHSNSNSKYGSTFGSTNQSRMQQYNGGIYNGYQGSHGKKVRSVSGCSNNGNNCGSGNGNGDKMKGKDISHVVHIEESVEVDSLQRIQAQYIIDKVATQTNQISQHISCILTHQHPKLLSILLHPSQPSPSSSSSLTSSPISPHLHQYLSPLLQNFHKSTICIYCLSQNTHEYYDMLSIRKQIKKQIKLLVQTNICNNSKTNIILKKLIDVVIEREKSMREAGVCVRAVVVRVRGVGMAVGENGDCNGDGAVEMEISVGDYGEIGIRDITIAQKMRKYINIYIVSSNEQLTNVLNPLKKKQKPVKQSQLVLRIKTLQQELQQKKKQLQQQKKKVQDEESIQAELEDIVLPSQRPMINIKKYTMKYCGKYGKSSRGRDKETEREHTNQ